jgi:2-polyprenyl-3-methyl-5-hydroxy-6-metoxy-1,4-benzoquinol methylase
MASVYGLCDGIDPVAGSIQHAKYMFPNLHFYVGELPGLLDKPDFVPYDVVISTEVIEHVIDKGPFVSAIAESILPEGYAIITTPRGELFEKYIKNYEQQPVEKWLTEKDLRRLFERHGFIAISKDRAYDVLPMLSLFHRLCASRKLAQLMDNIGTSYIHKAMEHIASIYQIWLFKKKS